MFIEQLLARGFCLPRELTPQISILGPDFYQALFGPLEEPLISSGSREQISTSISEATLRRHLEGERKRHLTNG